MSLTKFPRRERRLFKVTTGLTGVIARLALQFYFEADWDLWHDSCFVEDLNIGIG